MAATSPALVSRHFKHGDSYNEQYRLGHSGPEAIARIAAERRLSKRHRPSDWERDCIGLIGDRTVFDDVDAAE